ncbi:tRNA preQ1(34) S-adenosylmethionine ribosyltransferase-isomerase QueA [Candidatus Micrarchaeota archaeon]|jgi:S-adenosylmethionine:tRNA ribosyltransferase-isomerase|nr:tRNA preQ1(34) S-adenosylmethionine ribosyltransferase-isomerase QueA [Candidatus Micrarchaeota archaeon]
MKSINQYYYNLPSELIAQNPVNKRHESRLLIYDFKEGKINHRNFFELIEYLKKGDILVVNETKVVNTKLEGQKESGGHVSITIINKKSSKQYEAFVKCKNPQIGNKLFFQDGVIAEIVSKIDFHFLLNFNQSIEEVLKQKGDFTLPGYIHNESYDRKRYQTVFAFKDGSVAAPTAGLHFSKTLLDRLEEKGINVEKVCLHVGLGTFAEIRDEDYTKYKMHSEWFEISKKTADSINKRKGALYVVGTTSLRALESASQKNGKVKACAKETSLFVYPGYKFNLNFDGLITNFHLPRTSLLLLVASLIGDKWHDIYESAIKYKYRFYSFGDAMFIRF